MITGTMSFPSSTALLRWRSVTICRYAAMHFFKVLIRLLGMVGCAFGGAFVGSAALLLLMTLIYRRVDLEQSGLSIERYIPWFSWAGAAAGVVVWSLGEWAKRPRQHNQRSRANTCPCLLYTSPSPRD